MDCSASNTSLKQGCGPFFHKVLLTIGLAGVALGIAGASLLAAPPPQVIYTYDARPFQKRNLRDIAQATEVWDTLHLLAALQGLANRQTPQFYLCYCRGFGVDTDEFWYQWLRTEDGWLKSTEIYPLTNWPACVEQFRSQFQGFVVYDPAVPATSNVASTAAGCEGLLPVRYDPKPDSVYTRLTQHYQIPVKLWLVKPDGTPLFTGQGRVPGLDKPSSGSPKVDAYRWAIARYLDSGLCNARMAAYYIDAFWLPTAFKAGPELHTLSNHDYFIAHQAFFFDLSPWGDETPNDDPGQAMGLDKQAFLEIMRALYAGAKGQIIKVGGFTPWPFKYTDHAAKTCHHGGVPTEWEFGRLISQFNGYMEADAAGYSAMANASFCQHYPLAERYLQPNPLPSLAEWKTQGYVTDEGRVAAQLYVGHYAGDYDSPAWLYKAVPAFFRDPARGKVPMGWAFDPNLSDRAPQALVYGYRHATTNDFFIAGDSGAGYLNPRALTLRPDSGLPPGLAAWTAHCQQYYRRWDMTITGFMLDGAGGRSTDREFAAYKTFSPAGLGTHFEPGPALKMGVPTCREKDLPDRLEAAMNAIVAEAKGLEKGPRFLWARSILKSPAWYAALSDGLRAKYPQIKITVVDPYTFFGLIGLNGVQRSE